MLLTIDIGNSNIVIGAYPYSDTSEGAAQEEQAPVASWRLPTERQRTQDEYRLLLGQLWEESGFSAADFQDAALCSVVAPLTDLWRRTLMEMLDREPLVLHQRLNLGLTLAVDHPERVGVDRIADAVAVRSRSAGAAVAVDFGTATTFTVVDAEGRFCGGAIAPGLGAWRRALVEQASALPAVELVAPPTAIGRDTVPALQSGLVFGYTGLVEGLLARIRQELDAPAIVVASGGLGSIIAPLTAAIDIFDPWLTLAGIRAVYRLNSADVAPYSGA